MNSGSFHVPPACVIVLRDCVIGLQNERLRWIRLEILFQNMYSLSFSRRPKPQTSSSQKLYFFVLNLVKYYEFLPFLPFSIYFALTQLTPQLREMVTSLLRHRIEHKICYPTIPYILSTYRPHRSREIPPIWEKSRQELVQRVKHTFLYMRGSTRSCQSQGTIAVT